MNNKLYMDIALKEAKKAYNKGEIPVGTVIVKDNKIIAKAHNLKENKKNPTCHAEILAITKATKKLKNWRLLDCTIFVTMIPCPMCASAINQSRISKVVYGTAPEYANCKQVEEILKDNKYGNPVILEKYLNDSECTELLKNFFQKKRQ